MAEKSKPKRILSVIIIALAVLAVLSFAFRDTPLLYPIFSKLYSEKLEVESTGKFQSDTVLASCLSGSSLVYYDTDSVCRDDGKSVKLKITEPIMKSNGSCFVIYSKADNKAVVFDGMKKAYTVEDGKGIQFAKVGKNASSVVVTNESGYRSKVTVYDPDGKRAFRASFGEKYVIDAALSDDGKKLALCLFDTNGDEFTSVARFYDISKKEPYAESSYTDTVLTNIKFYSDYSAVAVGDIKAVGFSSSGEASWQYSYDGAILQSFSVNSSDFIALCLKKGKQSIVCIDSSGSNYEYEYSGANIKMIDVNNDAVMAVTPRNIIFVTTHGYEIAEKDISVDVKGAYMLPEDRAGIIVHSFGYETLTAK
ncbi:MAG: DUF5711 family protein [Clostridia bacterium]|nr:DUF5711 family protein [Clostridia bacterium]